MSRLTTTLVLFIILLSTLTCFTQQLNFTPLDHLREYQMRGAAYIADTDKIIYSIQNYSNSFIHDDGVTEEFSGLLYGSHILNGRTFLSGPSKLYEYENGNITEHYDFSDIQYIGSPSDDGGGKLTFTNYGHFLRSDMDFTSFDTLYSAQGPWTRLYSSSRHGDYYFFIEDTRPNLLIRSNQDFTDLDTVNIHTDTNGYSVVGDQLYVVDGEQGISKGKFDADDFELNKIIDQQLYGGQIYKEKLLVRTFQYNSQVGTYYFLDTTDDSLEEIPVEEGRILFVSDDRLLQYDDHHVYIPIDETLTTFDTITPQVAAADLQSFIIVDDILLAASKKNVYRMLEVDWTWKNHNPEEDLNYGGLFSDALDYVYLSASNKFFRSKDEGKTFEEYSGIAGRFGFADTTLIIGNQLCNDTGAPTSSGFSTDSENWTWDISSPPCFYKRFSTETKNRFYIYDREGIFAQSPGNNIYSWFGYYDKNSHRFQMVNPLNTLDFPNPNGSYRNAQYGFYVSPQEEFHVHPLDSEGNYISYPERGDSWYSPDAGLTYTKIENVPSGRLYPTPDGLGTLVVHNPPDPSLPPKFFVRYEATEPYQEIEVTPNDLPQVSHLLYNSEGQMIIASELGRFHVADDLSTSLKEVNADKANNLTVYPNPTKELIHSNLATGTIKQSELYDLTGRRLLTKPGSVLKITSIPRGTYILRVTDEVGRSWSEKVVVLKD